MNTLFIALQAAQGQQGSALPTIIMFAAIILVMWLFMIRPQRKQQKELQEFRNSLKKETSSSAWTSRASRRIIQTFRSKECP